MDLPAGFDDVLRDVGQDAQVADAVARANDAARDAAVQAKAAHDEEVAQLENMVLQLREALKVCNGAAQ